LDQDRAIDNAFRVGLSSEAPRRVQQTGSSILRVRECTILFAEDYLCTDNLGVRVDGCRTIFDRNSKIEAFPILLPEHDG
jgi:hypothetical protein